MTFHFYRPRTGAFRQSVSRKNKNDPAVDELSNIVTSSCVDLFLIIGETFRPSPIRSHYAFNLRDLCKVFDGFLMASHTMIVDREKLVRLYLHENTRVYHDRLSTQKDRETFFELMSVQMRKFFKEIVTRTELMTMKLRFGTFGSFEDADMAPKYTELFNPQKLQRILESHLDDMNVKRTSRKTTLVLFDTAIEHVCRITRIIMQPSGL